MLTVTGLVTAYGPVPAVDGVDLDAAGGVVTAVLGANGAGKTTLLRTISGLVAPEAGRVVFDGEDITGWPPDRVVRRGLAHVPEHGGVIAELTVAENLRLGGLWRPKADQRRSHGEVLDLFPPLAGRLPRQASTLSGGERQMLAIGRALMSEPKALALDEPSLGLAPTVTAAILTTLRELRLTALLVEQNARGALAVAAHGYVLAQGRVVASADADTLLADDQLRHAYLGF
ncbi:ABC transporter ATP-binding protein [Actinokineospora pegani]|uniref:ABC transporter ATP-binding protein n=1 Tax=Actinokineospora pegani TaxID=2654637 RepID=UPI0012EA2308|nr:ABC transporter ATP-binding protein [Actinokineospora pegani]